MKYNGLIFTHQSAFVKKSVYDKYGLYDITYKYVMDSELFIKFYNEGVKFRYIDELVVSMLAGGVSSKATHKLLKEELRLSKKYDGYSAFQMYYRWIKGSPRRLFVNIAKHFPKLWYKMIGKDRIYKGE